MASLPRLRRPEPKFGHPLAALRFWRTLVNEARPIVPTPFYIFSAEPIQQALDELGVLDDLIPVPVRHWLSCKTQPIQPLLQWWRGQGRGIEVVSEFEFLAARAEGFPSERILVNGPAKHRWLPRQAPRGIFVNFDSWTEAQALLPWARKLDWHVGVRCQTRQEFDAENPEWPTQFGMQAGEAVYALKKLKNAGVRLEMIHFHLRTNVNSPAIYGKALDEIAGICRAADFAPKYLDAGGGLPPHSILSMDGRRYDAEFNLTELGKVYRRALGKFEGVREVWLENGRFVSARSGVLVVRILEIKERRGLRQLICDGGRTMNALISNWEAHEILTVPRRSGRKVMTAVCGPTCMAFDQLARRPLSRSLRTGDFLVWMDAGAYHISWETRFSHGSAAIAWHEGNKLKLIRPAESFQSWWGEWQPAQSVRAG